MIENALSKLVHEGQFEKKSPFSIIIKRKLDQIAFTVTYLSSIVFVFSIWWKLKFYRTRISEIFR